MESAEQEGESSAERSAAAASSLPFAAPPPAAAWDLPGPDLMEDPATPRPPPRFDCYTNPAASHKRNSAHSSSPPPAPAPPYARSGNYGSNYPPPHQHHMASSPIHSPSLMAPDAPGRNSPWRSPMQFQTPMSGYRGTNRGDPLPWSPHSASPAQGSYPHSPGFGFGNSNLGRGGSPMNYGPRSSPMNYGPRGGSPMNYGPRSSPMNYGPRGSPYSSSGRGRGEDYYSSPGSIGRRGRGGLGFQNRSGWQDRRSYYGKYMVDDPWQDLQPIVGNILIPRDGSKSWLPESLRAKKNTSGQGQIKSTTGLSLAEYLDLSFNEASNKT